MTGSAKQSISPRNGRMDCFVAEFIIGPAEGGTRWLLAMTEGTAIARRLTNPSLHHLGDGLATSCRVGVAAEIPGAQRALAERALDCRHDRLCGGLLAEMFQHHRAGPDHADRVGNALSPNIPRRAGHRP